MKTTTIAPALFLRCLLKRSLHLMFIMLSAGMAGTVSASSLEVVTGPIPVTSDSYPWLESSRTQTAVNLDQFGYVEEEYILSGTANIYERATDGLDILIHDAPYTTRILVRRPRDPDNFNGSVAIEPMNEARGYDWSFIWALSHQHFIDSGMAWVGITHMPQNIDALLAFDPVRYADLSFANPNPAQTCGRNNSVSASEEGLHWDIFSQVGELLKNGGDSSPFSGFDVRYLYLSSHHGQAATYAAEFHRESALADGSPIYDGYLLPSFDLPQRLSRCGSVPAADDPRLIIENIGVPVIRFVPEGELMRGHDYRRADSDTASDPYRHYEIPGIPRMDRLYFQYLPAVEDQQRAGKPVSLSKWPYNFFCSPDIDELLDMPAKRYLINGGWANLDRWVRDGTPPPRAGYIALESPGTQQASVITDEYGNAMGGIRHSWVEVPMASYQGSMPAPCGNLGRKQVFSWAQMQALYGTPENYASMIEASIGRMVEERWITEADAARIRTELLTPATGF